MYCLWTFFFWKNLANFTTLYWLKNHWFSIEHNWDLVDSASSHMLVSRTKPCMPQNNCNAGVCAWLITSDAICRKNVAETHYWIPCAKRQANTWTKGFIPFNTGGACSQRGGWPCGWMKVQINASQGAVTLSSAESIHLAKAGLPAYFDEQLPYQPVMAV